MKAATLLIGQRAIPNQKKRRLNPIRQAYEMKEGYGVRLERVHEKILLDISRINLKWKGDHEIFDLDRFDKAVNCASASTSDRVLKRDGDLL